MMLVDFIVPTHYRINELRLMLSSLKAQQCDEWIATVMIDNVYCKEIEQLVHSFCDDRIRYFYMDKRYDDWGHTPRQIGKQLSKCKYVIMTGDDNYYTPNTVSEIKNIADDYGDPEFIYWNMIHSHYNYAFFDCRVAFNHIDMGAFATRNDIAKSIKLSTIYAADGVFVDDINRLYSNAKKIKIDKVLFVHN
jgi:hypothetical protein